ncbi:hypothetical protein DHD32_14715 [Arenibacter sp. TNZ]|jgi:hypothetical protein|uniref:hypothetical protein n=1 Tax=Arenibacter TaxID=178469 RepID=UPI000CD44C23|nr:MULTISPECIES: hypothetical protein [Arenibacter]MCM4172742.1 hypothetical protein [Arenibacter sp. TNZ]
MKNILLILAFLLVTSTYGQQKIKTTGEFVRVFDLHRKKIGKGKILVLSDSILQLKGNKGELSFRPEEIGFIQTKRAAGNNVLIGTLSGAVVLAVVVAASADPNDWVFGYTTGEGAAVGAVLGAVSGAALGSLSVLFKKSEIYPINGNLSYWKTFKDDLGHF